MVTVHLVTQRDQPYGSTRLCCERCGVQVFYRPDIPRWTDDEGTFLNLPEGFQRCDQSAEATTSWLRPAASTAGSGTRFP